MEAPRTTVAAAGCSTGRVAKRTGERLLVPWPLRGGESARVRGAQLPNESSVLNRFLNNRPPDSVAPHLSAAQEPGRSHGARAARR